MALRDKDDMDKNKLAKLKEVSYSLLDACGLCRFSNFPDYNWGTCSIHKYFHDKHKEVMKMTIHRCGHCKSFKREESMPYLLGTFEYFLKNK